MSIDVKSFLNDLEEINKSKNVSIKVPSIGKKVKFTQLSVNHQKQLLRTAFSGIEGIIGKDTILNTIITDNSVDKDVEFLTSDRVAIILDLRKGTVGSNIKIEDKEYDLNDLPAYDSSTIKLRSEVGNDPINVKVKVPTLTKDSDINTKMIAEFAKLTEEQQRERSIELVLTYETIKYVDSITIGDKTVSFDDISLYECKSVVESLPLSTSNDIINYISTVKECEKSALTFEDGVIVEIDASFLSVE